MIAVVTMVSAAKCYALRYCLTALSALQAPEGEELRFLVAVAGDLPQEAASALQEAEDSLPLRTLRGPDLPATPDLGLRVAYLRQRLQAELQGGQDDWVLWVDNDVVPEPEALVRLHGHGEAIVSGLCTYRGSAQPIVFMKEPLRAGLQEVKAAGYGLILVQGELARSLGWENYLAQPVSGVGEDVWWCQRARERGQRVWLDSEVTPWHVAETLTAGRLKVAPDGSRTWEVRAMAKTTKETPPGQYALRSLTTGYSPVLGEITEGELVTQDARGEPLTSEQVLEYAAGSQYLELVTLDAEGVSRPVEPPADLPAPA